MMTVYIYVCDKKNKRMLHACTQYVHNVHMYTMYTVFYMYLQEYVVSTVLC